MVQATSQKKHINNTNQSSDSSVNRQVRLIKTAQPEGVRGGSLMLDDFLSGPVIRVFLAKFYLNDNNKKPRLVVL